MDSAQASTSVTVSVDANTVVRTVDPRWFGLNSVMWDSQASSDQTVSLLKAAGVSTIRFPGGSLSDVYHWLVNKSETDTTVTGGSVNVNRQINNWTWSSGFDKNIQLIDALGCQTILTVNYGTGTPEEAAAWVAYANASSTMQGSGSDVSLGVDGDNVDWHTAGAWSALRASTPLATDDGSNFLRLGRTAPVGIKYWEIGNECYGTWETDVQGQSSNLSTRTGAAHDPTTYATRAATYIAKMKAVDPTIKVGVVVTDGRDYPNWNPTMLAKLKALGVTPDFVIYHRYPQNAGGESDSRLLSGVDAYGNTWAQVAATIRGQITTAFGSAGAGIEMVCTENNSISSSPAKQSTSLVNGLYLADSFGNLLQTEFNTLVWWAARNSPPTSNNTVILDNRTTLYGWRNYGDYGVISTPATGGSSSYYETYPTYYAIKLLSHFASGGDSVVKATSGNSLLSVYAARRADGTETLLVINKDPTNDAAVTFNLTGFTPGATTATVYSYGMTQDNAAQSGSGSTDIATSSLSGVGTTFTTTFTPYSMSVVMLPSPVPAAPARLSNFASGTTEVTLTWPAVENYGVTGYTIERATDSAFTQGMTTFNVGVTTSYVDATAVANTTYYYRVSAVNAMGASSPTTALPVTTPASIGTTPSHLVNISTRANCGTGNNVTIGGFVVSGSGTKTVLVRAVGPTLTTQGIGSSEVLVDPTIEVHDALHGNVVIASNDNWGDNANNGAQITSTAQSVGAAALSDTDTTSSALVLTLSKGVYSFVASGKNSTSGVVLVEVYDADTSNASMNFVNISSRANSTTGNGVTIGGFVIDGKALKHVLLRAVGPTLTTQGVGQSEVLQDPTIELHDALHGNTVIATNDNWGDNANASDIVATGARIGATPFAAADTKSSALLLTVPPGVYSFVARGKNNTTGIVLVEVYDAD